MLRFNLEMKNVSNDEAAVRHLNVTRKVHEYARWCAEQLPEVERRRHAGELRLQGTVVPEGNGDRYADVPCTD